jgi:hypothetical protein
VNIKNFKYKQTQSSTQNIKTSFKWFVIEIEALESFMLNALVVFILAEVSFVTNKINLMSTVETNLFPNYLYIHVYQLVNPIIIVGIGPLIYFSKHTKMKAYFKKQWTDCFN